MMLLWSVKTPNEKKEYPRNLSLNEVKSFYRNKLPVDLSALGLYHTVDIGGGSFVRNLFRIHFHNYICFKKDVFSSCHERGTKKKF